MLTTEQKIRLKAAVRKPANYTQENPQLDEVIKQIKKESPHLYHTKESLPSRKWINAPSSPVYRAGLL